MSWRISSCFDCKLLKERKLGFYCLAFKQSLTYDVARTVNDCERKQPFEDDKGPHDLLLDRLFTQCMEYTSKIMGPFTARELVTVVDYKNKNSLWGMLESLVRQGRLRKGKMRVVNRYGHTYRSNVYFPVWPKKV